MIYAFTGQPGAGKTLNGIKFTLEDKAFAERDNDGKPTDQRRDVYYYGIKGVKIESWTELTEHEVLNWFDLPDGSVIFIDECQDIWRPRASSKAVPKHVEMLEKHRHRGIDFVLTFQFPKQIDTIVRELITDHFHFHRALGLNSSTRYKWDYLCLNPKSPTEQKKATESMVAFDKKIFDLYHSASLHTSVKRIPWKVWLAIPLMILVLFIASKLYKVWRSYKDGTHVEQVVVPEDDKSFINADFAHKPSRRRSNVLLTNQEYLDIRKPRFKNIPDSAIIYDPVKKVVSFPILSCIRRSKPVENFPNCVCYSQQGSKEDVEEQTCNYFVDNGYPFNPYLEDSSSDKGRRGVGSSDRSTRTLSNR